MRVIGIDLAVKAKHRAIIGDDRGQYISPVIQLNSCLVDLDKLRSRALQGADPGCPLVVVMEATDIIWYPISVYFLEQGDTVYVVNPRMSADLGRFYKRHAKSDKISAKVLVRIPLVSPESIYPLRLAGGDFLALQRGCKELDRLTSQASAIKNRLQAIDRLGWPGLHKRVFSSPTNPEALWFRDNYYNPNVVVNTGIEGLRQAWQDAKLDDDPVWIEPLYTLAKEILELYGEQSTYLDYEAITSEVQREQKRLATLEAENKQLQRTVIHPLYRRLHPSRNLETVKGVGQDSAAVYLSFVGVAERFINNRSFRGWSGLVPCSEQSGEGESKRTRISKAGPNLVKKYAYLDANVARQYDPQLASIYYDQMVNKGKHHSQAVCACATHLLDRMRIILNEDRPYELRDVNGTPVTPQQARIIIRERYIVPKEVRQRNNKQARRLRTEDLAERKEQKMKRRSRSR